MYMYGLHDMQTARLFHQKVAHKLCQRAKIVPAIYLQTPCMLLNHQYIHCHQPALVAQQPMIRPTKFMPHGLVVVLKVSHFFLSLSLDQNFGSVNICTLKNVSI